MSKQTLFLLLSKFRVNTIVRALKQSRAVSVVSLWVTQLRVHTRLRRNLEYG